jgi:hypothetical protein
MTRRAIQILGSVAIAALSWAIPAQAEARAGSLDLTFGSGGALAVEPRLTHMVVGSDGSTTFLGFEGEGRSVVRLLANGEPDSAFGLGGSQPLEPQIEGLPFVPSGLAVDSQRRVIVFGTVTDSGKTAPVSGALGPSSVEATWAVVLRLKADGSLDTSFGGSKGFTRSDFELRSGESGLSSGEFIPIPTTNVFAGTVDPWTGRSCWQVWRIATAPATGIAASIRLRVQSCV